MPDADYTRFSNALNDALDGLSSLASVISTMAAESGIGNFSEIVSEKIIPDIDEFNDLLDETHDYSKKIFSNYRGIANAVKSINNSTQSQQSMADSVYRTLLDINSIHDSELELLESKSSLYSIITNFLSQSGGILSQNNVELSRMLSNLNKFDNNLSNSRTVGVVPLMDLDNLDITPKMNVNSIISELQDSLNNLKLTVSYNFNEIRSEVQSIFSNIELHINTNELSTLNNMLSIDVDTTHILNKIKTSLKNIPLTIDYNFNQLELDVQTVLSNIVLNIKSVDFNAAISEITKFMNVLSSIKLPLSVSIDSNLDIGIDRIQKNVKTLSKSLQSIISDTFKTLLSDLKLVLTKLETINAELENSIDLINAKKSIDQVKDSMDGVSNVSESVNDTLNKISDSTSDTAGAVEDTIPDMAELAQLNQNVLDFKSKILENAKKIGTSEFENLSTAELRNQLEAVRNNMSESVLKANEANLQVLLQELDVLDSVINKNKTKNSLIGKGLEQALKPLNVIENFISKAPGGNFIIQQLGFDEMRENVRSTLADFGEIAGGASIIYTAVRGSLVTIQALLVSIGGVLKTLILNPWILLIGLLAIAISRFKDVYSNMTAIREQTGLIGDGLREATQISKTLQADLAGYGLTLKDSNEAVASIIDNFGTLDQVTRENAIAVGSLSSSLNMGVDESTKLLKLFSNMTGYSGQLTANLIASLAPLATASKVPLGALLKDIASSSGKVFEFTNGLPDTIAKTAVEARRLGINLDTVANIANKLSDFESSIESEMNAMVLTQRSLNLEQARYYAITGETDKLLGEVRNQLGSFTELQGMLPFQQKAFADALGLSVDELRTMVRTQEELDKLNDGTISTFQALQNGLTLADIFNARDIIDPFTAVKFALQDIYIQFSQALLPIIELFLPVLHLVAKTLELIANAFRGIDSLWGSLTGNVNDASDATDGFSANIGISILKVGGLVLAGYGLIKMFSLLTRVISIPLPGAGIFSSIGKGISGMISAFSALNPVVLLQFAAAMGILTVSAIGIAYAFKLVAEAFAKAVPFVDALFDGFVNIIGTVGDSIVNIITAISTSLVMLSQINFLQTSAGIVALAGALTALTLSIAGGGIIGFFTNLTRSNIIDDLINLGNSSTGIILVTESLEKLVIALEKLKNMNIELTIDSKIKPIINDVDLKVDDLTKNINIQPMMGAVDRVMQIPYEAPLGAIQNITPVQNTIPEVGIVEPLLDQKTQENDGSNIFKDRSITNYTVERSIIQVETEGMPKLHEIGIKNISALQEISSKLDDLINATRENDISIDGRSIRKAIARS